MTATSHNEKGPASAPTLPDHGSNNPSQKVTAMNTDTNSTSAPLAARKAIDVEKLRSCSMKQLRDFREVVHHLTEALAAFTCQPRFEVEKTGCLNAAGEVLDDICDLLHRLENEAVRLAKEARPRTVDDTEWRAWTILGQEADFCDDLSEFSVLAVTAARDEAAAQFAERYARKAVA